MLALMGGTPRSGTTWITHIAQNILIRKGWTYDTVNANAPMEVRNAVLSHVVGGNRIIHFHSIIPLVIRMAQTRQAVVWYAFRDPGDIVVSQMRLRDIGFDQALNMASAALADLNKAIQNPEIHLIPYATLLDAPQVYVFQMARSFGISLSSAEVEAVVAACSFEKNKEAVARLKAGQGNFKERDTGTRRMRSDPETLLTDRHIQSGQPGRWREELTDDQQRVIETSFKAYYEVFQGF